ncbi:MAG: membrane protein insertase YidC [Rickettsiales bacterium]|jgi:YidC/Oxa1 family membrane protein insertase|nr:membrane protein insertase YidC [Rickettsiales bacterium]
MVEYMNNGSSGFQRFMAAQNENKKPSGFKTIVLWALLALVTFWVVQGCQKKNTEPVAAPVAEIEAPSNLPVRQMDSDKISLSVQGNRISKIELKEYADGDKNILLLAGENEFAEIGFLNTGLNPKRDITVSDYIVTIVDTVANNTGGDLIVSPYARVVRRPSDAASVAVATGGIAYAGGDIERENWRDMGRESFAYTTQTGFVGFEDQYWETIVSVSSPDQTIKLKPIAGTRLQAETSAAPVVIARGQTAVFTTQIFAGPKTTDVLNASAVAIPGIDNTIDYGWFWFLSRPILWAINAIHGFVGNYGVAIILLTILIRILMWPLTRKSFTGMAAMQKMQPEMQRIQRECGNDKMRMQAEMMAMYKRHGSNPMSGCLPMLLQIPIFFAIYKALLISVPMRDAGFLWISDLATMDPYFILPLIMGATMWWQQKLQESGTRNQEPVQKIMKWMPWIFVVMFAFFPAGLVLYWATSNLFGIGQMWWIKRSDGRLVG